MYGCNGSARVIGILPLVLLLDGVLLLLVAFALAIADADESKG